MQSQRGRLVWDRFVRLFHWSLVFGITGAYISACYHYMNIHLWIGYGLSVLVAARILWGFIGSQYARFSSFNFDPVTIVRYLISIIQNRPQHFLGHNPAGAAMVFLLLGIVIILLVSGFITLGVIDFDGPFLVLSTVLSDSTSYQIQAIHEWVGNYFWVVVAAHIFGVFVASTQHHENLILAMLTGIKKEPLKSLHSEENMQ